MENKGKLLRLQLARTGTFGMDGAEIREQDLQDVIDTFDGHAPVSLGHYGPKQDWWPSYGNVVALALLDGEDGGKILEGDVEVNPLLAEAIDEKFYTSWTLSLFAKVIERHKAPKSIVYDEIFGNRTNTPSPYVNMADMERKTGNVAVTARGSAALPVGSERATLTKIEPMPIRLKKLITGAELNDLRQLFGNGDEKGQQLVQTWVEKKLLDLMTITENTRNALCAQALTGKIDYMMQSNAGYERYQVQYGDGKTLKVTPEKLFTAEDATLGVVIKTLRAMQKELSENGAVGEVKFLAGQDAFDALVNLIIGLPNDQRMGAKVEDNAIIIGGKRILLDDIS